MSNGIAPTICECYAQMNLSQFSDLINAFFFSSPNYLDKNIVTMPSFPLLDGVVWYKKTYILYFHCFFFIFYI